jgi:hypothetical protein
MHGAIEPTRTSVEELVSLNIDALDVAELERRLEMAVVAIEICGSNHDCNCGALTSCTTFCK